jgi:ribosome-associated protein
MASEESIRVTRSVAVPRSEILLRYSRSSGPGGQHAQTSETRVEAVFDVERSEALTDVQKRRVVAKAGPVLRAVAQDERSQHRNREPRRGAPGGAARRAPPPPDRADRGVTGAPPRAEAPARADEAPAPAAGALSLPPFRRLKAGYPRPQATGGGVRWRS